MFYGRLVTAMELHQRLQKAREHAGFKTVADAVTAMRFTYSTYAGHENASSGFRAPTGAIYARKFGVRFEWLMNGTGPMLEDDADLYRSEEGVRSILERIPGLNEEDVTFVLKNIRSALSSNGAAPLQSHPHDQSQSANLPHESEPSPPRLRQSSS